MFQKKNLVINCDKCDARKIDQEDYSEYEQIVLNCDLLIVDQRSKGILNRLPITVNHDTTLELEDGEEPKLQSVNGNYEITGKSAADEMDYLFVNGNLIIRPGTEEILKKVKMISVNGNVIFPESLGGYMGKLKINGASDIYPDEYEYMGRKLEIDRFFPLKVKENQGFYASSRIIFMDQETNAQLLVDKKIRFCSNEAYIPEKFAALLAPLFDIRTDIFVIPEDLCFLYGDVVLDDMLLEKKGKRLYVLGNVTLNEESENACRNLEKLVVTGNIRAKKNGKELVKLIKDCEYSDLDILPDRSIANKVNVKITRALLEEVGGTIRIANSAAVTLAEDIPAGAILDQLSFLNCGSVKCTDEQAAVVNLVAKNVGMVGSGEDSEDNPLSQGIGGIMKNLLDTKMVNADEYVL